MKLFIYSAIIKEIEWARERSLIDGVMTNPTLLGKADRKLGDVVNDLLELVSDHPVAIQIVSQTSDEIIEEAKTVAKLAKNVVVSIPMTDEGLMAATELSLKGTKTNITLVQTVSQALLAARTGAAYVTFGEGATGSLTDAQLQALREAVQLYKQYDYTSVLIAGGIKDAAQISAVASTGVAAAAVPTNTLVQMYRHTATDNMLKKFLDDWEVIPK